MPNIAAHRLWTASTLNPYRRRLACAAIAIALLPGAAMAQNRRAAGGGWAGLMGAGEMRQALDELNLTGDEKTKVDAIVQKAQADARDATQGLRDATPAERQDKLKDLQKLMTDTKAKVEAELTPDQKVELAKKLASLSLTHTMAAIDAEKKKVAELDVPADQKRQADTLFDETTKTLDGYKADADAVKDDASGTAVTDQVQKSLQEANRQVVSILGQDDGRQVVQAGRQAMRGPGGGAGGRRRAAATEAAK